MSRTTRVVIIFILIFVLTMIWSFAFDKVWPSKAEAQVCETTSCTSTDYARHFRQGDLHNSRHYRASRKVKRLIHRYYRNHPKVARRHGYNISTRKLDGKDPWWDDPFRASECMIWGDDTWDCIRWNFRDSGRIGKQIDAIADETSRVVMKCGGAAAIGAMGGRLDSGKVGVWGAVFGAGSCGYQTLGARLGWW